MLDASTRAAAAARGGLIDLRFAPPPRFDLSQVSARLFCRPLRNINGPLSKNTFCAGRHTPTFDNKQHVYRRAARLYYAAFKLDPSKSGRKMVAWLRSRSGAAPTPMEMETVSAGVRELRPGKKPRAEAAGAALSVA